MLFNFKAKLRYQTDFIEGHKATNDRIIARVPGFYPESF